MLQVIEQLQSIGLLLVVIGIILVVVGFLLSSTRSSDGQRGQHESKGVLFIGPIPIVWGLGRRGWYVACAIAAILLLLCLLVLI